MMAFTLYQATLVLFQSIPSVDTQWMTTPGAAERDERGDLRGAVGNQPSPSLMSHDITYHIMDAGSNGDIQGSGDLMDDEQDNRIYYWDI